MVVRSKWITRRKNGFSGFGAGITGTGILSVSGTIACDLEPQKHSSGHAPAGLSSTVGKNDADRDSLSLYEDGDFD